MQAGEFVIKKDWIMSENSEVVPDILPHWMGQITLKGVEIERVRASRCNAFKYCKVCTILVDSHVV